MEGLDQDELRPHDFFIRHQGKEMGPFDISRLRQMWAAGEIDPATKFKRADWSYWGDAEDLLVELEFKPPNEAEATMESEKVTVPTNQNVDDAIWAQLQQGHVSAHEAFMRAIDKNRFKPFLPVEESYFPPLKAWALRRYELVYDGHGAGNYSAWDIIALLDAKQIDLNAEIRLRVIDHSLIPKEKTKKLGNSEIYKYVDFLRSFAGTSMQVMLLDSLEKLRIRFVWFSIGIGLILLGFFLSGIRVYVAQ